MSERYAGRADGLHWADIQVETMAALGDGRIVTGDDDGRVLVRDLAAPQDSPAELGRHKDKVCAIDELTDGRVISASNNGWVLLWRHGSPGQPRVVRPAPTPDIGAPYPPYVSPPVRAMTTLSDGRIALVYEDGEVDLWDPKAQDGDLAAWSRLGRRNNHILTVAKLPDGRIVTGSLDGRVLVWDPTVPIPPARLSPRVPEKEPAQPEPRQEFELGRHKDWVRTVAALPDGRAVSGGKDRRILLCDPADGCIELAQLSSWVIALVAVQLDQGKAYLVAAQQGHGFSVWPVTTPGNR